MHNFIDSFITAATLYPNKPAIRFHDEVINYQELHQRSSDLAHHIINLGIKSEEIIPLILERDPNTIISMIGILKAGCAFLPVSPITPCSRIRFILEDSKARIVISNIDISHLINSKITVIIPTQIQPTEQSISLITTQSQLAYAMYTSGSTGNPKGVLIEHGSMMNLFSSIASKLNLTTNEHVLALTDYTFDISLIELLLPILHGATILLTEQGTVADGVKIKYYLKKNKISLMQATPLTWEILIKQGWKNNGSMKILVGGEKFRTRLAELLDYKKGNIWNMYGPTETSMWSMYNNVSGILSKETVPLGQPINNTIIEILDSDLNSVAAGSQGELYIGGNGLARKYLNNSELTCEKFIYHPQSKTRLYRTGDLVTYDTNEICYVGRSDDQLKFGGIRIEAGEIESVIEQEPIVKKSIVKVHETEGYYKVLAAYIEIDEETIFSDENHVTNIDMSHFLKNIYDETYLTAKDYEHGEINNCGWQNSFTGELFGLQELNESYQFVREIIQSSDLSSVLEVGCGTGALLLEYIDKAKECSIVEISSTAIDYVENKLNKKQLQKTTFRNESILNIHNHKKFSCIIVNSVIQYLPSIHSLITAITQLVEATKSNGTIIIGDVRALELLDIYLLEKIRANNETEDDLLHNLDSFYYKSRDAEVVLSPKFFFALKNIINNISHVDIAVKHGDFKNELNYFRYDVILHIDKCIVYKEPILTQYERSTNTNTLLETFKSAPHISLILKKIPNLYIQGFLKVIDREIPNHIPISSSGQETNFNHETKNKILDLINFKINTHDKFIVYDEINPTDTIEIHFHPKLKNQITRCSNNNEYLDYRSYCREPFNPWLQKFCIDHIKLKVSQHVVSWVNPSVYVWVEKWPLSINGKLNKKILQLPVGAKKINMIQIP
jgi:amino acid adenylation domain-containing protein